METHLCQLKKLLNLSLVITLEVSGFVTPRNFYTYKLEKIIMIGICIGISYGNNNDRNFYRHTL